MTAQNDPVEEVPEEPGVPPAEAGEPALLYRVRFQPASAEAAERAEDALMRFDDPAPAIAAAEALSPESFVDMARQAPRDGEMLLLVLPGRAPDLDQWRREAEQWMDGGDDGGVPGPALRAAADGAWILWRPGRAVVAAPRDRAESLLAAVADFEFHHAELLRLERELARRWPALQEDLPLVHHVGRKELRLAPRVKERTARALDWRLRSSRIERRLLAPANELSPTARRLGQRLRELAEVEDRLEALDGRIEVFEYDYELINQRLSDFRLFLHGLWVEILIVALLAFEAVLLVWDLYLNHFAPGNGE
jgi:hypothetical protein